MCRFLSSKSSTLPWLRFRLLSTCCVTLYSLATAGLGSGLVPLKYHTCLHRDRLTRWPEIDPWTIGLALALCPVSEQARPMDSRTQVCFLGPSSSAHPRSVSHGGAALHHFFFL
ncbi:hypothetical protein BCV70DRAFT_38030 [Testicularia cyperi]|uniref:Uncharacterized protein n=1 Tax=Testicularia cyperi TaxID=1882483 RepID=A0A317XJT8_9BASI|nr:hypothetical protein BCV70DRAFT_38030 [Testicularia cyperi]